MTCLKPRSQFVSELETYKFLLRNGYWLKSISLIFCPAAKDSFCSHSEFGLSSVQFSLSVVSDSLWPHELQYTRPPCPSPTPRAYPNSCPLSRWYHPTISFSVVPFSFCPQSFPGSGSFQMSQLFASGGQSIGVSASASVLPVNTQDWFSLGWTGWISLQSKGLKNCQRTSKNFCVYQYIYHHLPY